MTEEEWLKSVQPYYMLELIKGSYTNRKSRLFACACCRRVWHLIELAAFREAVEMAEDYSDGRIIWKGCKSANKRLQSYFRQGKFQSDISRTAAFAAQDCLKKDVGWHPGSRYSAIRAICPNEDSPDYQQAKETEEQYQAELLRDIFGNPFRPVSFNPSWRTSTAVGVAQQMYDSREFNAMPILADALQDAGCEDDAILSHCRDENGIHVRGCWVVDLVLNKS